MGDTLIPIVVALIGAITGVASIAVQFRKNRADVAETYEAMANRQAIKIDELQSKVDVLETEVKRLREELRLECVERERITREWSAGIELLIKQVVSRGDRPIWRPE